MRLVCRDEIAYIRRRSAPGMRIPSEETLYMLAEVQVVRFVIFIWKYMKMFDLEGWAFVCSNELFKSNFKLNSMPYLQRYH